MVTAVDQSAQVTLSAVEHRIDGALTELTELWRRHAEPEVDVLGERDLPWLIGHAEGGGKRVRPLMAHWGWVCAGAPETARDAVVDLGAAIELLHVFALIHDDVMDRSALRRGRTTTHVLAQEAYAAADCHGDARDFGDAIAILAGDLVHAEAGHLVAGLPEDVRRTWRVMMIDLVVGQRRDLTGAALGRRDLDHAREVARLKSGTYTVAGPLRMGAMLGGAPEDLLAALDEYAGHLGEVFGLRDDILGVWGDPGCTGKSVQDDLEAGKATVLLALAAERLSERGQELLARTGTGRMTAADLAALREEMTSCGIREQVENLIADELDRACAALESSALPDDGRAGLVAIAHRIAWRQS